MRVIYQTSVYPEDADIVKIGKTKELTPEEINCTETVDYLLSGSLVMKNGKIDKILFDGGYAQDTSANSTTDKFAFYYYNQDHLGNNREVVDANGVVQQVTNYYPFGAPYADATAIKGAAVQPYKYNGKELDLMHGLNTYDYGARQHDPILCRWDRIDLLCEADYGVSPYSYCNNSPINAVDPDGNYTVFINGFKPPFNTNKTYWIKGNTDYSERFDIAFGQDHERAIYKDGSDDGVAGLFRGTLSCEDRYDNGYARGKEDAENLLFMLKKENGVIVEPLILATHSMGGAFGKGYAQAIMEYYNKHKNEYQGFEMYEFDFAPFNASKQKAVKGVQTVQIHDIADGIAPCEKIEGAYSVYVGEPSFNTISAHQIDNQAFWKTVSQLSEGRYRVVGGTIVPY